MWTKRNPKCESIKDVIFANTGMTLEELNRRKPYYRIDQLREAADVILKTVNSDTPISVVADYDADGICAAAIMFLLFMQLGKKPKIRLPRRFSEGYGLSESIVDELEPGLLITVDNGIVAHAAIQKAKDRGFYVIVTDHHLSDGISLPPADIIIDPNAIPGSADFNGYCGAGIAYKLAIEILGKDNPLIPVLLSFAAIATVADVVPLVHENRFIVKDGLKSMLSNGKTVGLAALLERCGYDSRITAKDIGFKIAPILNAPGRLEDDGAMKSLRQLVYNGNIATAKNMADELYELNETRKVKKTEGLEVLENIIKDECLFGDNPLCIYAPGLNEGLVGIYAGSLAETYSVPCFVFTDSETKGIIKGSGRSFGGVHLKNLLDENAEILYKYGGHAEAAGVSVKEENFDEMKLRFMKSLEDVELDNSKYYDLEISNKDIPAVIEELQKYEPFGTDNPEPIFFISDFSLTPTAQGFAKTLGQNNEHIKLFGAYANAIAFNMASDFAKMGSPRLLQIYGNVSSNYFMGKAYPQVEVIDMKAKQMAQKKTALAELLAKKAGAKK